MAELLRLAEPRGPNPTELGRGWCPGLGLYSRTRANSAIPQGIAGLVAQARSASGGRQAETERFGRCWWRSSCDPLGRAVRRHPMRRAATRRSSLLLSAGGEPLKLRASSAIRRIAVLGAQRTPKAGAGGGVPKDEWAEGWAKLLGCAFATLWGRRPCRPSRYAASGEWATGRTWPIWAVLLAAIWAELLRLAEPRGPEPPPVASTLAPAAQMGLYVGADTAIKTPCGRVYSERQRN